MPIGPWSPPPCDGILPNVLPNSDWNSSGLYRVNAASPVRPNAEESRTYWPVAWS